MVRGEINKKTAYIQARSFMARTLEINGKARKAEGEAKVVRGKLHLENARKLRGIYFIDPEDTEFKETIKNARKKLETSVAPAMPCKIMINCGSGASNKLQTKLACILEADESTRMRLEIRYRIIMKTILQEKVKIHYSITIWFTSLFLCPKPTKHSRSLV